MLSSTNGTKLRLGPGFLCDILDFGRRNYAAFTVLTGACDGVLVRIFSETAKAKMSPSRIFNDWRRGRRGRDDTRLQLRGNFAEAAATHC